MSRILTNKETVMTKENTPLWHAEQNLQTLKENGADQVAIKSAEEEIVFWKLKTREFVIGMVEERFNWIVDLDLQGEVKAAVEYELRHILDALLGEIESIDEDLA